MSNQLNKYLFYKLYSFQEVKEEELITRFEKKIKDNIIQIKNRIIKL